MKDYKQIWDNLSTNFNDAAFFVCCIDDEDEIRKNGALTAAFLRDVLQIGPQDKVLEIGCGVGRIGRELAPACGEWHGVDISSNMIAYAKQRTEGMTNVYLHELPDSNLSIFPDNTFDCVYSSIVFMHLDKPDMFNYMKEAYRVLKPDGRAYFDTYNLLASGAWQQFLLTVESFPPGHRPGHMSQFSTPQEMRKFMEEAGFVSVHVDDQSTALVVALGQKPSPTLYNHSELYSSNSTQPGVGAETKSGPTLSSHTNTLEEEIERKNAHIAELEALIAQREAELVEARRPRLPWKRRKQGG